MDLPRWLKGRATERDLRLVADAIGRAEARSSGEIVPMVVRSSSPVGHAGLLTFALLSLALWTLAPLVRLGLRALVSVDVRRWTLELGALGLAAGLTAVFSRHDGWLRWLISPRDRTTNVGRRALHEFHASRINEASAHTGVLLFVSLLERRAVVLADWAIAERIPQAAWQDVVDLLLKGLRERDLSAGYVAAIERAGDHLAEHFPAERSARRELPNELVIRD